MDRTKGQAKLVELVQKKYKEIKIANYSSEFTNY